MKAEALAEKVLAQLDQVEALYHRLVVIAGFTGSGKTASLQKVAEHTGAPLVNLNLELSRRMLELTERQRALQLPRLLEEVVGREDVLVLLDNIEILFDLTLRQDPLRLLESVSRNRTVVAAWNGTHANGRLTYATPEHPEYRRYSVPDLMIVCPEGMA